MDSGLILVLGLIVGVVIAFVVYRLWRPPSSGDTQALVNALADLRAINDKVSQLSDIKERLVAGDVEQQHLKQSLERTSQAIEQLRMDSQAIKRSDEEALTITRRIESVFYGSYAKGRAGENVLAEALKLLPQDMVTRNLTVNGKIVEFGLVLTDGRTLPVDSKWPASDVLLQLEEEKDTSQRERLVREIEREVERRIREVAQYIDPAVTTPYALAAVPDSALSVCTTVYAEAHRRHVLLMSYSMTIPYLLALYRLHMQYCQTVDLENLKARLSDIGRSLDELDAILENRIARSATMAQNAYTDCKQLLGRMRGSLLALSATGGAEALEERGQPNSVDGTPPKGL